MTADYARFGRQIALPELGAAGQAALATRGVRAPEDVEALARRLWQGAGGGEGFEALPTPTGLDPSLARDDADAWACVELGVAAWSCVEAARETLGMPSTQIPDALLARLSPSR
jgi:hypothetical protein